ncbi:MAG: protein kinase [Myxococcota bacterium]|nr:protein kinase [Myxococcota bacterium]MDW8363478.1 protein kinase [Myxococcales bacterium]
MQPAPLQPFGKYLLDREIARGGMARVFLARLRGVAGFEKRLVVKQVLPELASDPRFVAMFVEEAKTLVAMSHPHVVPVYELGVVDGVYFLAMEHVEGATLAEVLAADGPLPVALALHVGAQVADALAYAHERFGLVHRDVTPRNVIVDDQGHARLLDFGIAAPAHEGEAPVFGTPGYMSPEQAAGERVGPPADVFALGAVLFEAITGEPAFRRATRAETDAALAGAPPTLAHRPAVPPAVVAIVDDALRREPDRRPTASAVAEALRAVLASLRPQGVARELGERASRARTRADARFVPPSEPREPGREPSGVVRSIATSVVLDRILQGQPADGSSGSAAPGVSRFGGDGKGAGLSHGPAESRAAEGTVDAAAGSRDVPDGATDAVATLPIAAVGRRPGASPEARRWARAAWLSSTLGAVVLMAMVAADIGPTPSPDASARGAVPPASVPTGPSAPRHETGASSESVPNPERTIGESSATASTAMRSTTSEPSSGAPSGSEANGAPPGLLSVTCLGCWADVRAGRRRLGTTPVRAVSLPAGTHVLTLDSPPLGRRARVTVRIASGQRVAVRADMNADPPLVEVTSGNGG